MDVCECVFGWLIISKCKSMAVCRSLDEWEIFMMGEKVFKYFMKINLSVCLSMFLYINATYILLDLQCQEYQEDKFLHLSPPVSYMNPLFGAKVLAFEFMENESMRVLE